uniref:Hydroxyproline-rich glycoprotein family protein n=1 Tax=Kalanchoe fedtschenkoi TaxID=63787 RepID=A0A7N0VFJ6_KALFE
MDQMESPDYPPPLVDVSRPSLGFPIGTALLLLVIFSLSGVFSCCYHWDKLRSIRHRLANYAHDDLESSKHSNNNNKSSNGSIQSLPVLMPGDGVPRFIALPCPCQPLRLSDNELTVQVQKPPAIPPKSPRIAVPLY